MNMKKVFLSIILVFCFLFLSLERTPGDENPVTGIVLVVTGNVFQQVDEDLVELKKGSKINSILFLCIIDLIRICLILLHALTGYNNIAVNKRYFYFPRFKLINYKSIHLIHGF